MFSRSIKIFCLLSIWTLNIISCAWSEKVHGIAMHNNLKYGPNFQHFNYANPQAPKGGKIKFGVVGTFNTLNPFVIRGSAPAGMSLYSDRLVFQTLMARSADEPFSLYGLIAEYVDLSPDRSSITFYLNPKARWADGKSITADDVIFSHATLKEKGSPNLQLYYSKVDKVEKISDLVIKFTFKPIENGFDPEAPFLLGLMTILPKHIIEPKGIESFNMEPILGSGPYTVVEVKPGHKIRYKYRNNYWARDIPSMQGRFNFDEIVFDYYRHAQAEMEGFKSGAIDVHAENNPLAWKTDYHFTAVKDGRIKKIEFAHHLPVGIRAFAFNTRRDLFKDRRVRQALTYAFDFEWLNHHLFQDSFMRTESYFPNTYLASSGLPSQAEIDLLKLDSSDFPTELLTNEFHLPQGGTSQKIRQNNIRALSLLKEAGWEIQTGKLKHQKIKKPFRFEILLYQPEDEKIALAFARSLKPLGIEVSIRSVDSSQYQSRMSTYDYDVTLTTWGNSLSPGREQEFYWGSQGVDQPNSRNYSGIHLKIVDDLCNKIGLSKDIATLTTAVHALDRVLLWNYFSLPLYHKNKLYLAYWDKFGHPDMDPHVDIYFSTWWSKNLK